MPSENKPNFYIDVNPDSYYRFAGSQGVYGDDVYSDILKTGAIRGSREFEGNAFFAKGEPQQFYLTNNNNLERQLNAGYKLNEVGNNNYLIEVSPNFNAKNNPLYYPNDNEGFYTGLFLDKNEPKGTYRTLNPIDKVYITDPNPELKTSFIDRINPANQKGIRVLQAYTPNWISNSQHIGFEYPVNWNTKFDYTKPFLETSLDTHGKNLIHIGKTIMSQPEMELPKGYAGASLAVQAAVTPYQIYQQANALTKTNTWDKEYGQSDPFALRALIDAGLGNQSPAGGFTKTITSPEYAQRNPLGATIYGTATGNLEYPKAFIQGYIPNFMK